ncbi:DUF3164 family protein [Sulfuriflexus mobilis]|uniref:DUF3164 family protein n=1 Tax=Sulfuriflexus mobilis TaxID=1811807 RepID=UPI000F841009|nr:DUF3164 family protein [Sulfuriflexus mobilis]
MTTSVPEGFIQDQQGRLVPLDMVKDIDRERHDLVNELVTRAKQAQQVMARFKGEAMGDIEAFIELSAEKYNAKMGGQKGNVTLTSFDGRYKIQRAISEYLVFDERLQVAKALVDECIHEWTQGSRSEIRALVDHAFQVDKEGKVNTSRILGLKRLDIKDPKWRQAMQAIADSMQIAGSKTYLRLYERIEESGDYEAIPLDIAAL